MRTRRRVGLVLVAAAAFGVALIAFPAGAGAAVPNCTPPTTAGNDSCVKGVSTPSNPGGTYTNMRAFVRTRTIFEQPSNCAAGGCAHTVILDVDNDLRINFGAITPTCSVTKADGNGQDIAGVWADCGPGAGVSGNAYESTQIAPTGFGCNANPCVSGQAAAYPGIVACTLIFNGPLNAKGQHTVTLYARAVGAPSQCLGNPATNHNGTTNVVLKGTITASPLAGYGKRLTVTNIEQSPLPLIDFYAYIKRGNFFQIRCPAGASPWKLRAQWVYSGTGQANDTSVSTQACS
jgi:hypothetical protein